ncbi:hypothetical protein D0Z08_12340 [Nocardioides immobilis]|uniref:Uncharacterized protein n=1 Tax=Nocardioides immobilis TaxID=2049295 RepID=A0A417Y2T1_9ACTN|nr:hypothetical protein [Nocardioides immobilis]RHW26963.1 hypothetical protein D0Z08_12340 [Nocardioides immobilis]
MAREDDAESADLAREQEREREWQQIVENYGERALLDPEDAAPAPAAPQPVPEPEDLDDPSEVRDQVHPEDEFVPPTPPPIPRPPLDRLLAWLGVFGVPAVVLFCIVAGISVPSWFGLLMAAGFLGGFGYLVLRMSDEPRDPWDDGAVL